MTSPSLLLTLPLPFAPPAAPTPALRVVPPPPSASPPKTAVRIRQAWLALRFPDWHLYAALHAMAPTDREIAMQTPLALMQEDRQRSVLCCNRPALERGIRPGHSLNAAIALCADLQFVSRDEPSEQALLQAIALECDRYTPTVVIQPPNELLLEVRGSLRLFGGVRGLLQLISTKLQERGLEAAMALSSTPMSAQWLCRATATTRVVAPSALAGAISELPLQVLQWPVEVCQRLRRFGITNLGDLLRLPRAGLTRRIGKPLMAELDRATGRYPDLRQNFRPPLRYRDRVLLDFEIETTTLAQTVLERRLASLQQFLIDRTLAIGDVSIVFRHRDHADTPIRIGLAAPTADMAHVVKLLCETLHALQLPAPIREMRIVVDRLVTPASRSGDLAFSPTATLRDRDDTSAAARLLEQFRARLGRNAIQAVGATADYRPEHSQTSSPAEVACVPIDRNLPIDLPLRPLWILAQPKLLPSIDDAARRRALQRGPERIQSGWWDGASVDRDYFVASSEQGSLWWVFQDRTRPTDWYLHGLFA